MCIPSVFISEDGKGFVVRKGGIDWTIKEYRPGPGREWWSAFSYLAEVFGEGSTILEAVDNALAKIAQSNNAKG